jgi:hypothetical protein
MIMYFDYKLLRAHGLMRKVSGTWRYQLTETRQKANAAILTALRSTIRELIPEAA